MRADDVAHFDDVIGIANRHQRGEGTITRTLDPQTGYTVAVSAPGNVDVSFGYDGQLLDETAWTGPVNASLRHVRDNDFRVTGEFVDDDFFLARSYDFDGFLQSNGPLQLTRDPSHGAVVGSDAGLVQQATTLNPFGEPDTVAWRVSGAEALGFSYTRDKLGPIVSREERRAGTSRVFDYSYDVAGRLVVVEEDGAVSATYSYDDNGNRTDAVVDEQDRLLSNGTFTYGWDADGALVSRTDTSTNATTRFAYDTLGGLRQVTLSDGRVIDYVIDGLGRRIGKRVDGVLQQGFVYDGQLRIVAELDGSGVVRRRYVYSSHANVPDIAIDVLTGETWRIITDHLGSPRLVVDIDDGAIVAEREFDEFGRVVIDSAPGLLPFGFAGGLEDPDTGLVRFGARDYDPESGHWTAKDPIGFNGGTTNLYEYVANDPVNRIDPTGLVIRGVDDATLATLMASPVIGDAIRLMNGDQGVVFDISWAGPMNEEEYARLKSRGGARSSEAELTDEPMSCGGPDVRRPNYFNLDLHDRAARDLGRPPLSPIALFAHELGHQYAAHYLDVRLTSGLSNAQSIVFENAITGGTRSVHDLYQ